MTVRRRSRIGRLIAVAAVAVALSVATALPASARPVTDHTFATWNLRGATYQPVFGGRLSLWHPQTRVFGVPDLSADHDVVAVQEAGNYDTILGFDTPGSGWDCTRHVKMLRRALHCDWTFKDGFIEHHRIVFFVESHDKRVGDKPNPQGISPNLAVVVKKDAFQVQSWNYIPPIRSESYHDGDRGVLQLVLADNKNPMDRVIVYNAHADANPPGANVGALLRKIRTIHTTTVPGPTPASWVLLGDFNIEPKYVRAMVVPPSERVAAPSDYTLPASKRVVDYMVWQAADTTRFKVTVGRNLGTIPWGSDHRPAKFIKQT